MSGSADFVEKLIKARDFTFNASGEAFKTCKSASMVQAGAEANVVATEYLLTPYEWVKVW